MADYAYRTFLLPQLLIKLGVYAGVEPDRDYVGHDFMQGEITAENANQLVSTVHEVAVLLNLAGYQLEAVALAAQVEDRSAGIYVNLAKGEYTTRSASSSESQNALQYLIQQDFPDGDDLCLGLRLTPRPRWWHAAAPEQYYALQVPLDNVNVFEEELNSRQPSWLLLGGVASNFPTTVKLHDVLIPLDNILTDLKTAIATALAEEWDTKPLDSRGGLLPYLNPDKWGGSIVGTEDALRSHYDGLIQTTQSVYQWLESLSKAAFQEWLLSPARGCFKETIRNAQAYSKDPNRDPSEAPFPKPLPLPDFKNVVKRVFIGTHPFRDWAEYDHLWDVLETLDIESTNTLYTHVLMFLEELTVIDMLGRVRQTDPGQQEILPFDITGFYEQVPPPDSGDADPNTYDFHTLQINQAGVYAQGHWQKRVQISCSDTVNGNRYMRFDHYRFCLDTLPGQSYDLGQDEFFMQVYRWRNTNFLTTMPYLKMPDQAQPEVFCNQDQAAADVTTARIAKTEPLEVDTLIPEENTSGEISSYGVEIELDIDGETLFLRRVSPVPYLAQADLIEAPEGGRLDLLLVQRFPLHSLDKVRILAGIRALIDGIQAQSGAFASHNILPDTAAVNDIAQLDRDFAEWMARYVCYNPNLGGSPRTGPHIEQIRHIILSRLAQEVVWDDHSLEILTLLTVFLRNTYHLSLMKYTRAILGDALPQVTPEMEAAVRNSTAGLHVYRWGTNGLGEKGQTQGWSLLGKVLAKSVGWVRTFLEVVDDIDTLFKPFSFDANIYLLEIEKLSPLDTNAYPGWATGEIQTYFAVQAGGGFGLTSGIFFIANSSQTMYSSVNWDPGDFTGFVLTFCANAGAVFDLGPSLLLRIDVNSWVEHALQNWTPVELLGELVGFDAQNLKIGFGLSTTFFIGNTWDGQLREPIRSGPSFNFIDYSVGVAGILEANAMPGFAIHLPEIITGSQATPIPPEWGTTPATAVLWRVIESNSPPWQNYNVIDEWELEDSAKAALRQMVAEYLACFRDRRTKLTITGHASPVGPEAYNLWLSQKRAQAVYDYIRSIMSEDEYAILPHNTAIEGYGEWYPNLLGAAERDPEWQTVMVYINGQVAFRMGEEIGG